MPAPLAIAWADMPDLSTASLSDFSSPVGFRCCLLLIPPLIARRRCAVKCQRTDSCRFILALMPGTAGAELHESTRRNTAGQDGLPLIPQSHPIKAIIFAHSTRVCGRLAESSPL